MKCIETLVQKYEFHQLFFFQLEVWTVLQLHVHVSTSRGFNNKSVCITLMPLFIYMKRYVMFSSSLSIYILFLNYR